MHYNENLASKNFSLVFKFHTRIIISFILKKKVKCCFRMIFQFLDVKLNHECQEKQHNADL